MNLDRVWVPEWMTSRAEICDLEETYHMMYFYMIMYMKTRIHM